MLDYIQQWAAETDKYLLLFADGRRIRVFLNVGATRICIFIEISQMN